MGDIKPIRSEVDHEAAMAEVKLLWGAPAGTPDGDRLDVLVTLIDAYEAEHYPMDPPHLSNQAGLEQLLAEVTDENRHPETDTGHAVGNEFA